jgi:signal peptidase I
MLSLIILAVLALTSLLAAAVAAAWAARAVGSPRGRIGVGLLAVLAAMVVNGAVGLVLWAVAPPAGGGAVAAGVAGLGVQLVVLYVVLARVFRLSGGPAFAPFGGYLGASVGCLVLAVAVVRPYVVEAFVMPTASMSPTVVPGDRFCANKLLSPRRWDLVAYVNDGPDRAVYCKRLVGLPGERLRFEGGQLYVNDQLQAAPAVVAGRYFSSPRHNGVPMPDARWRDGDTIQLGPNDLFFVGDDPDISGDSRMFGPTDRSKVVGVVDLRYWPAGRFGFLR